jgi:hypothetical protein
VLTFSAAICCLFHLSKTYNLLFATSSQVLKQFGRQYLGGEIGFSGIIHTGGQTLQPHIHVHDMVTGGALVASAKSYEWRKRAADFLVPVVALAVECRKAFCAGLLKLHQAQALRLVGACAELDLPALVQRMLTTKWEVYIQKPVAGSGALTAYLGRYMQKTASSNQRILKLEDGQVTFAYRDNTARDGAGPVEGDDALGGGVYASVCPTHLAARLCARAPLWLTCQCPAPEVAVGKASGRCSG